MSCRPGPAGDIQNAMTVIVPQQFNNPSSVLISSTLCSADVLLPDTGRLAVRVLISEAVSTLSVEVHHLDHVRQRTVYRITTFEQPFIEKMRQTHINYLTYRYNDRVKMSFYVKQYYEQAVETHADYRILSVLLV